MSKHTPGPWHVTGFSDNEGHHLHIGASSSIMTIASMNDVHIDSPANARLIAAAPAMLEALQTAYTLILQIPVNSRLRIASQASLCMIRDAIVDAIGEDTEEVQVKHECLALAIKQAKGEA